MGVSSETGSHRVDVDSIKRPESCIGIRHLTAFLLFLATTVSYAIRVNMSIAIVAMVDNESSNPDIPVFDWDSSLQSIILSSFFWGYVVTQVPSGLFAQMFGAKWLLFTGILICSIGTLLTPVAAIHGGWGAVCAVRVIQGLSQAALFPCIHSMLSKWAPPVERGRLATIAFIGNQVGIIIAMPVSGVLASSNAGWPSIFYVFGSLGLGWCVLWAFLAASTPAEHKLITQEERNYIEASFGTVPPPKKLKTPWKALFFSAPMWGVIIAHCAQNWGFWTLMTEIPTFMKQILDFNMQANGLLSALPYLVMFVLALIFAFIADLTIKKGYMRVSVSRKFFNSIGFWGPALALVILNFIDEENTVGAVVLLVFSVGLNAGVNVGFQVNHIDLSPNFAGTMMGITNCISNIMSIIAPLLVGLIVTDQQDISQWRIVFWIAAAIYVVGNIVFITIGETSIQPWDDPEYTGAKDYVIEYVATTESTTRKEPSEAREVRAS